MESVPKGLQRFDWQRLKPRERFLTVITVVALLLGSFLVLIQPARLRVRQDEARVAVLTGERARKEAMSNQLAAEVQALRESRKSGEVAQEISLKAPDILPGGSRLSSFLEELTRLARQRRVEFVSIRPESVEDRQAYLELSLRIDVKARYPQFGEYLAMLEDLPRALIIDDVSLETGNEITPFVMGRLKVITFLAKQ